ncbi:hypothetical protein JHK84_045131 [Glycine max]|nr:hypothetical protein JHK86_045070 [Glycine max]KAG5108224.1 hypothetical protein JHK84_045131 [Glycine max]
MDAGCQSNCVGAHRIDVTRASIARLYGGKLRVMMVGVDLILIHASITVAVRNVGTTGEDLFDVTPGFVVLKAFLVHNKSTMLVALGKVYDTSSSIHNVPYANDMVRVSVVTVYHGDAQMA